MDTSPLFGRDLGNSAGGFSNTEMLTITGIPPATLFSWDKRGQMPEWFSHAPGRGNRRKYTGRQVMELHFMRSLVDAGLPISDAWVFAPRFAIGLTAVGHGFAKAGLLAALIDHLVQDPPWAMIARRPDGWKPDGVIWHSDNYLALAPEANDSVNELNKWARGHGLRSVILLDQGAVSVEYLFKGEKVLKARKKKQ